MSEINLDKLIRFIDVVEEQRFITTIYNDIIECDIMNPMFSLKTFLLNMKVQIDRWDLTMSSLFLSSLIKKYIVAELNKNTNVTCQFSDNNDISLWGIKFFFLDKFPNNKMLGISNDVSQLLASNLEIDPRHFVVGKINSNIEKLLSLKAFW